MYEYTRLDVGGLKQLGISFETMEESVAFAALIQEELEERVGRAISERLSDTQLDEFDSIVNAAEAKLWLRYNCPDYPKTVQSTVRRFIEELLQYRRSIDGLYDHYEMRVNSMPIENLDLTPHGRSYNCLKRARMQTVGDLVEGIEGREDLLKIRNLGMRSAEEIMRAIMEYQYYLLSEEGKIRYLKRVEELNA